MKLDLVICVDRDKDKTEALGDLHVLIPGISPVGNPSFSPNNKIKKICKSV